MRDATEEERKLVKNYVNSISKPTGITFDNLNKTFSIDSLRVKKRRDAPLLITDAVLFMDIINVIAGADSTDGTEKVFSGKEVIDLIRTLQPVQLKEETVFTDIGTHEINKNAHIYECAKCHHKMMISLSEHIRYCPECGAKVVGIL